MEVDIKLHYVSMGHQQCMEVYLVVYSLLNLYLGPNLKGVPKSCHSVFNYIKMIMIKFKIIII